MDDAPALRAVRVTKSYHGLPVLTDIDFEIGQGEFKAVVGPSGSGKSTLLRLLALLERPDAGEIHLAGQRVGVVRHRNGSVKPAKESILAKQRVDIGMVFQNFNLFPHLTAIQNVMLGLTTVLKIDRSEATNRATELLRKVGLQNKRFAYPSELSGGQQQRVAIARALVMSPKVMLFDEPTSALDPELVRDVLVVMEGLAAEGMTMVAVTHEIAFARRAADAIVMFDEGSIVEEAPPSILLENPVHERTRRFLQHVV